MAFGGQSPRKEGASPLLCEESTSGSSVLGLAPGGCCLPGGDMCQCVVPPPPSTKEAFSQLEGMRQQKGSLETTLALGGIGLMTPGCFGGAARVFGSPDSDGTRRVKTMGGKQRGAGQKQAPLSHHFSASHLEQ
jgi:hypothetical protein